MVKHHSRETHMRKRLIKQCLLFTVGEGTHVERIINAGSIFFVSLLRNETPGSVIEKLNTFNNAIRHWT